MRQNKICIALLAVGIILFAVSFALAATTLTTEKGVYASGENVTLSGTCDAPALPVGLRATLDGNNVWIDEAKTDAGSQYKATFLPPQKGKYTLYAACKGNTAATASFCVGTAEECQPAGGVSIPQQPTDGGGQPGDSGQQAGDQQPETGQPPTDAGAQPGTQSSADGGAPGGGPGYGDEEEETTPLPSFCTYEWECSEYGPCTSGKQYRACQQVDQCDARKAAGEVDTVIPYAPDPTEKDCDAPAPAPKDEPQIKTTPKIKPPTTSVTPQLQFPSAEEERSGFKKALPWLITLGIIAVGGAVMFFVVMKKRKRAQQSPQY